MSTLDQAFVKAFEPSVPAPAAEVTALAPQAEGEPAQAASVEKAALSPASPAPSETESVQTAKEKPSPGRRSRTPRRPVAETRAAARSSAKGDAPSTRERPTPARPDRSPRNPPGDTTTSGRGKFRPMLEVDGYLWPKNVGKLASPSHRAMGQLIEAVRERIRRGQKAIGLQGCRPGDGSSTLLLAVARRLADHGLRVAMVDADFRHPTLARRLGLSPTAGWEEAAPGRLALADVVVESLRDGVSLAPWCASAATDLRTTAAKPAQAVRCLDELRRHYDAVLVDLGSAAAQADHAELSEAVRSRLDAILVVRHASDVSASELEGVCQRLAASGKAELAVVENFV